MIKNIFLIIACSILTLNSFAQQTPPSADEVLQTALSKAKAEKKNVFIIFHASWCGWCHKMDAAMSDSTCKKFFDDNYVIEHLTVHESPDKKNLENPGAEALLNEHSSENDGIPFWLIYDGEGKIIADSKLPDGSNMGCPGTEAEVNEFINILKKTSSINEQDAKKVFDRFRKNELVRG